MNEEIFVPFAPPNNVNHFPKLQTTNPDLRNQQLVRSTVMSRVSLQAITGNIVQREKKEAQVTNLIEALIM